LPAPDTAPYTSSFRPRGATPSGPRKLYSRESVSRIECNPDLLIDDTYQAWRLSKIECTVGQSWILRIALTFRVINAHGVTKEYTSAVPSAEVNPTTYVTGDLSSTTVSYDIQEGEYLHNMDAKKHATEHLFTDIVFVTNKRR